MYIARVPNRKSRPAILLRESYREGGKVCTRTIANLTNWSAEQLAAMERLVSMAIKIRVNLAAKLEEAGWRGGLCRKGNSVY